MRRYIRDMIIDLLETILEGANFAVSTDVDTAYSMLSDCYDAVGSVEEILLKNISEERAKEYEKGLDDLKETLENINEVLQSSGAFAKSLKKARKIILSLQNKLRNDPEIRFEIVFMPYKASMWDSLESIWREASASPLCDAYVVPIPYYSRKSNGSFDKLNYDGDMLPDYVPIIYYQKYDLASRRPDAIFVHNPYDGGNIVTSVHPDFYSEQLKKYTDMLVYVPYFVSFDKLEENFYKLPSFLNFDLVIAQSQEHKQQMATTWFPQKIAALGSPKLDKIIYTEAHKPEIPDDWRELIGNRKVVLFVTSIGSILNYNENHLKKLLYVFQCFESEKDLVLLWRPHPLSVETYKSMKPHLYEQYIKIEKYYREKKIGILDDSSDLNRAIAISDAYYGDYSSVIMLYGLTGKPMIKQRPDIIEYDCEKMSALDFFNFEFDDDEHILFYSSSFNGLFRSDINTGVSEFMGRVQEESSLGINLYSAMHKVSDRLISPPDWAKEIVEYNISQKMFKKIKIDLSKVIKSRHGLTHPGISVIFSVNDKTYFLSAYCPGVFEYNINNGEVKFNNTIFGARDIIVFPVGMYYDGHKALIPVSKSSVPFIPSNVFLEYDVNTKASKQHTIGRDDNKYLYICCDGVYYWLFPPSCGPITRYDTKSGETIDFNVYPDEFRASQPAFCSVIYCGGYMLAIPYLANMVLQINTDTGAISEFKHLPVHADKNYGGIQYSFAKSYGDWIYAFANFNKTLYKYNIKTSEVSFVRFTMSESVFNDIFTDVFDVLLAGDSGSHKDYIIDEGACFGGVAKFLANTLAINKPTVKGQKEAFMALAENSDGSSGAAILKNVLARLMQ